MNRYLLVVGIQKGQEEGAEKFVNKLCDWINAHAHEYTATIASIRVNTRVDNFERYQNDYSMEDTDILGYHCDSIVTREGYGLSENGFKSIPRNAHVDVVGMNTHSSVYGVALDLFSYGYEFNVLSQWTWCQEGKKVQEAAIKSLEQAIGSALK